MKENEAKVLPEEKAEEKPKKEKKPKKERKPWSKKKKIILSAICGVLAVLIAIGGISVYKIMNKPQALFEQEIPVSTPAPEKEEVDQNPITEEEDEGPSAYELLMQSADKDLMKNTLNILLIGVDYAEERETWGGKKDFHADVMMILAINFEENTVDMISIPRDTYAKIPGVDGIYKINASIDCGGGFPTEPGFAKVCEAAEWMLGGIPVDYYYAVTMPAVKQLVDAIGGVDFNLEYDFGLADRHYKAGYQHMDGQAVLDFLRVRKNQGKSYIKGGGTGDLNRVNRQKDMLVEIFKSLQSRDMLAKLPDILGAFEGQLYTNTTPAQTAALALFAYNLNHENIDLHSMDGRMHYGLFHWNFVVTDQQKRVEIIEEVYGIKVDKYNKYSSKRAQEDWEIMRNKKYLETAERVLEKADKILAADRLLATPSPSPSPSPTVKPSKEPEKTKAPEKTKTPEKEPEKSEEPEKEPEKTKTPEKEPEKTNTPEKEPEKTKTPEKEPENTKEPEEPVDPEQQLLSSGGMGTLAKLLKKTETSSKNPSASAAPGRKYGEEEELLYEKACELFELAKKEGKKEKCLKETNDSLQETIIALAKALDIDVDTDKEHGKDWVTPYWNKTNEIKVDFN